MKVSELSGGVGGARLARGLAHHEEIDLTVVVNVGDDDIIHGLRVSPDIDTVIYTLAGVEGPAGWGRADDTFTVNDELGRLGVDNRFRLGDMDLALNIHRTDLIRSGAALSDVTTRIRKAFGIDATILPATDDRLSTEVKVEGGDWLSFQDYFVLRSHRDTVLEVRFATDRPAQPAPGVLEALEASDTIIIGPSNPPLSIWPILAVEPIRAAVAAHPSVIAVSPLIGARALKGPADRVMASLGLPVGNAGVLKAYDGLLKRLVIHTDDAEDADDLPVDVAVMDTLIADLGAASDFVARLLKL